MNQRHIMSLYEEGFDMVRRGKQVEVRLYDPKRQKLKVGDDLTFQKLPDREESMETEILEIQTFKTFEELYEKIGLELLGRSDKTMEWMLDSTRQMYTEEEEKKYGAVAIFIKTK